MGEEEAPNEENAMEEVQHVEMEALIADATTALQGVTCDDDPQRIGATRVDEDGLHETSVPSDTVAVDLDTQEREEPIPEVAPAMDSLSCEAGGAASVLPPMAERSVPEQEQQLEDEEPLGGGADAILSRARALCQAANQLSESLAPIRALKKSPTPPPPVKTRGFTRNIEPTPSHSSGAASSTSPQLLSSKQKGSYVMVPSTVAVIQGSSLITCKAELKQSLKRGDLIRIEGREYVLARDRQLGTSTFELTENYVGETHLEAPLEVFRRALKPPPPQDTRPTSELIRELFPDAAAAEPSPAGSLRPRRPSQRARRSSLPEAGSAGIRQLKHVKRASSTSGVSLLSSMEGLGPILEEPSRPATEPPRPQHLSRRRSSSSSDGGRSSRVVLKPIDLKKRRGGNQQQEEEVVEDPDEVYRKEQKALEGLQMARDRVKAAQKEKAEVEQRRMEEEAQKAMERQLAQERAKKDRQAAAMRLARLRSEQKRVALEMAASYKVEQERKRREEEERIRETNQSLRRLRERTKERMAKQKLLAEEWAKKEEQEVREQLVRRRKESEAICRQFLRRAGSSSQEAGKHDDAESRYCSEGEEAPHTSSVLSEAPETHEVHDKASELPPANEAGRGHEGGKSKPDDRLGDSGSSWASAPDMGEPPALPAKAAAAGTGRTEEPVRLSGIRAPGWTQPDGAKAAAKPKRSKRPVWKQAPVPVAPLEEYIACSATHIHRARTESDDSRTAAAAETTPRLVLPPLPVAAR